MNPKQKDIKERVIKFTRRCPHSGKNIQRQRKVTCTSKEASKIKDQLRESVLQKIFMHKERGEQWWPLVEDWYQDQYKKLNSGILKTQRTTVDDSYSILETYTQNWAKTVASNITRADVKELLERCLLEGKSLSRVKAIKSAINGVFEWGIDSKRVKGINRSPSFGISIGHKQGERRKEVLSQSDIKRFLQEARKCEHPYFHIWATALLTGCRTGELIALEWKDVCFESKLIHINKSYSSRVKGIKSTKSGKWRDIPINSELEKLLRELKASPQGRDKFIFPRIKQWLRGEGAKDLKIFLRQIGIKPVRFHDLRASFATHLLSNGVGVSRVMKICGWEDTETANHYVRLAGVDIKGATECLSILSQEAEVLAFPTVQG